MPKREGAGRLPKKEKPEPTKDDILDKRWKDVQNAAKRTIRKDK